MYKALIVDDEKPVRIAVSKLGKWTNYQISPPMMASNGEEALAIMRKERPQLVFADMNMPVMNGADFLKTASALYPETRFIVISGYDDFQYTKNAIKCGAMDYLLKPVDETELNEAIGRAITSIQPGFSIHEEKAEETNLEADTVIGIIHDYIDQNYASNIRISMFADRYFFSREYLTRQFKAHYGMGIYEYVLQVRMMHAKRLLGNPALRIQDIALQVGYPDTNYFSKAFRSFYKDTPSTYRASLMKEIQEEHL